MRLGLPFVKFPLAFDVDRLQAEVRQLNEADWKAHPTGFAGNTALPLISLNGGDNDDFGGPMMPTPHLRQFPYIRQVLASFGVVWSRSRLMRVTSGANVPPHVDTHYHWFHRVRVHIPIITDTAVLFSCGDKTVHMAAGEAWTFDNWRSHTVHNGSDRERIHLVADTCGNANFWQMVARAGNNGGLTQAGGKIARLPFDPSADAVLYCERQPQESVMAPAEVDLLIESLLADLALLPAWQANPEVQRIASLMKAFSYEWRTIWSLFGSDPAGHHYGKLRDQVKAEAGKPSSVKLPNGMSAAQCFSERVLDHCYRPELDRRPAVKPVQQPSSHPRTRFDRPVFIVASPRSGSSLLYETLTKARALCSLGGEAHWLEGAIPQLLPWSDGLGSNRLTEERAQAATANAVIDAFSERLFDWRGLPVKAEAIRFLEKTPKNALRIPFLRAVFPDARFIFLWRDPQPNISSIIDAWNSGGWVTYPNLEGWDGPWSLLLPPGWRSLRGRPVEEIAAFQWCRTCEIALDDLAVLPRERWTMVNYEAFLNAPETTVERLCRFMEIEFDQDLRRHLQAPLPLSRHTLAPPSESKWKRNASLLDVTRRQWEPLRVRLDDLQARFTDSDGPARVQLAEPAIAAIESSSGTHSR